MGQKDQENSVSEDEAEAEKEKLRPNPPEEMEMTKIPIKMRDGHPEVIAGQDDPLIKSVHLRYLLIGFNGFVAVLGIALLAVSIWLRVDPEFWEYETTLDVDNFHTVCAMLIVASLVLLIVGFLGCMGAISEQRWMLILNVLVFGPTVVDFRVTFLASPAATLLYLHLSLSSMDASTVAITNFDYMTLFSLIFLIELAAIVIMWYAPYSSTISSELEKQIQKQIDEREHDDSSRYFMDFIQEHLYCCGSKGIRDYGAMSAPNSCLNPRSGDVYITGCATKMLTYLRSKAGIVGGLALPILFVQLLAIVASGCLIKRLEVSSSYFMGP